MIYAASLSAPIKKAYGDKCYATNVQTIIENLKLDPEVSDMQACIIGPKDVVGINRQRIQGALKVKHPDVCVVYLFQKDKESELLDTPFKKELKKITPETAKDAVDTFIDDHMIGGGKTVVSRDTKAAPKTVVSKSPERVIDTAGAKGRLGRAQDKKNLPKRKDDEPKLDEALGLYYITGPLGKMIYVNPETRERLSLAEVQAQKDKIAAMPAKVEKPVVDESDDDDLDVDVDIFNPRPGEPDPEPEEPVTKMVLESPSVPKASDPLPQPQTRKAELDSNIKKNLEAIKDFHDWDLFKQALSKDTAIRSLLEENASFQGVVQMLSVMDTEIKSIFYDVGLTAEQKFEKVLEIGGRRSTLMATHNDMLAKRVIEIMDTITISARRTVEEAVLEYRKSIERITISDKQITDESSIHVLVKERVNIEFELLALVKQLIGLYQAMDLEVSTVLQELDANIPSDNAFINNMLGSYTKVLTPTNTEELVRTMVRALQSNREKFVVLEDSVRQIIDVIHNLLEKDKDIIEHQQYVIKMLKAHKVEDVVVLDSILKNILHIYIGVAGTGRTSTALTWSGVLSRRKNVVLLDLTRESKLRDYGVEPIRLEDFMTTRIERSLCVVEGRISDGEALMEIVRELKTRLDHYSYINVICDYKDVALIKDLATEAFTLNYITDCTSESMARIADTYAQVDTQNVARKLLMIDPPIDVISLAKRMNIDVTTTKCITIPNLPKIKMCSVVKDAPYEYSEVRTAYEEAFR